MHSTKPTFDYEKKRWGEAPVKSIYTDFQGIELVFFLKDALPHLPQKTLTLLDSGCGAGNVAAFFKKQFPDWKIYGIDVSSDAIKAAKTHFKNITFTKTPAHKLPHKRGTIDVVTALDSLEHYDNLDEVLVEIHRVLSEQGLLYVSIPLEKQFPTLYWVLFRLGWRGKMHYSGHVNFFTNKELRLRIEKHGFTFIKNRYSSHFFFSLADIGYYFIQSLTGNHRFSFETTVYESKPGLTKTLLTVVKKIIAGIAYIESVIFSWFPGGKGNFVFIKNNKDFFSNNPPLTVLEEFQAKYGLKKVFQPRDIAIREDLARMQFSKAKTILDFGCASGVWLERLLSGTKNIGFGVDIADQLIKKANTRKEKKGIYYNTLHSWPIHKNSIDFCYSFDTFEHIKKYDSELNKLYDALKKGSKIYFYTINPKNKYTIDWFVEKLGSDYMYKRADHKKEMFIDPEKFKKDLEKAGFKNISFRLYDGPCNLLWRVFSYAYLSVMNCLCNFLHMNHTMDLVITVHDAVLRFVHPLNQIIDGVFIRKGYSNGYFMWGEK